MAETEHILVLCTYPDKASALDIAQKLLAQGLAACINISAPMTAVYRWKGETHVDEEVQLVIKTRGDRYEALEAFLESNHPYELAEILRLPLAGSHAYLKWIDECVQ